MLEFLLDLRNAVRQKFSDDFVRLYACKACHKLTECTDSIGAGISGSVIKNKLENQVEERVRKLKAEYIKRAFERFEDGLFHLATSRVFLATLFGEILIQRKDTSKERCYPI